MEIVGQRAAELPVAAFDTETRGRYRRAAQPCKITFDGVSGFPLQAENLPAIAEARQIGNRLEFAQCLRRNPAYDFY